MADAVAEDEKHRLTAVQRLVALSLDALSKAQLITLILQLPAAHVRAARGPAGAPLPPFAAGGVVPPALGAWHPNVPLVTLTSTHRSLAKPLVKYLCDIEAKDKYHKLVVLIPEVQPRRHATPAAPAAALVTTVPAPPGAQFRLVVTGDLASAQLG